MGRVIYDEVSNFLSRNQANCVSSLTMKGHRWNGLKTDYLIPDQCIVTNITNISGIVTKTEYVKYTNDSSDALNNVLAYLTVGLFLVLLWITCVSTNRRRMDYYRCIAFYILGTMIFSMFEQLGPAPGFSRFIGFGIMTHNMGEFNLLFYLWFGRMNFNFEYVVALGGYVMAMMVVIVFGEINFLFIFGSIQGASMDLMLITTYTFIACKFRGSKKNERGYSAYKIGCCAAFTHVASIFPIFLGMWLANANIQYSSTIIVAPAFFIYVLFAAKDLGYISLLGTKHYLNETQESDKTETELETYVQNSNENIDSNENLESGNDSSNGGQIVSSSKGKDILEELLNIGILGVYYKFSRKDYNDFCCNFKKFAVFWIIVIVSIIGSIVSNLILIFAPCIFDARCVSREQ